MCTKISKISAMILGGVALVLLILGVIGYFIWLRNEGSLLGVANYWNYLYASIPFSLLSACFMLFVIAAKDKD